MRRPHSILMQARWPTRKEAAEEVAARLGAWLAQLGRIDPRLRRWHLDKHGNPCEVPGPDLTSIVQAGAVRSEDGDLEPISGFDFNGVTIVQDADFSAGIMGRAGGYLPPSWWDNDVSFEFRWHKPDRDMVTFDVFHAVALALIACWEPTTFNVRPGALLPNWDYGGDYANAWMTYVWPEGVPHVDLARVPVVYHVPNGGLLLSATTHLFDMRDPRHMEAAKAITDATRHLNQILHPE